MLLFIYIYIKIYKIEEMYIIALLLSQFNKTHRRKTKMKQKITAFDPAEETLRQYLSSMEVGRVQRYENMEVVPLYTSQKSSLDYILLDEAMDKKGFKIDETGNVNTLGVLNRTNKDVLIVKGEYVVGGKQNRMVSVNALIQAKRKHNVSLPVHCIEQGRWNTPGKFYAGKVASPTMRHGLEKKMAGQAGQNRTWEEVGCALKGVGVYSDTSNFDEFYKQKQSNIDDYVEKFQYTKGQVGFIVAITNGWGEKEYYIDLFDKPKTMKNHFERMLASYVTEALNKSYSGPVAMMIKRPVRKMTQQDAIGFINQIKNSAMRGYNSIDLGTDVEVNSVPNYRIKGPGVRPGGKIMPPQFWEKIQGSALVYKGTVVYFGARKNINDWLLQQPIRLPRLPRDPRIPMPIEPYPMPPIRDPDLVYPHHCEE